MNSIQESACQAWQRCSNQREIELDDRESKSDVGSVEPNNANGGLNHGGEHFYQSDVLSVQLPRINEVTVWRYTSARRRARMTRGVHA